jgi:integrase
VTITPPSVGAVRSALAAARKADSSLWCFLQVAVATGARRSEVCALRWCDLDLDKRVVRIDRSVSATKSAGVVIKTTKTGKSRLVTLTVLATGALSERRAEAVQAALAAGRGLSESELVFSTDKLGLHPWRPSTATGRWTRLRGGIGLRHVRLHDFRHFVATECLGGGIDGRTVSNRLGHSRTSTTIDSYWGFVPARDRQAADYLDALLTSDTEGDDGPGALPRPA